MSNRTDRRDDENDTRPRNRVHRPIRVYQSQFSFGVKRDHQTFRIGCGLIFVAIGVWMLLWIFDIIELDPRYIWIPFAVVLVAIGLRLLLTDRR
jgi:hypothetical protein